jgi:hypothetical protein
MMSETIFEMMMRIGLKNEVSAGLLAITNQLNTLHTLVGRVESAFGGPQRYHQAAIAGREAANALNLLPLSAA